MDYTYDYDPAFLKLINEWDYSEFLLDGSRPSNPDKCSHLWKAKIPTNNEVGEYLIEIKAKDMFGREFTEKTWYDIVEKRLKFLIYEFSLKKKIEIFIQAD
jgi:hypothetical protein